MAASEHPTTRPVLELRPTGEPRAPVIAVSGSISRGDIRLLSERMAALLGGGSAELVVCDVGGLSDPDAVTIDALAHLWLTARRLGYQVRLDGVSNELQELLSLVGLCDVLSRTERLLAPLEFQRETEQREEARGVEEEADPRDRTA